GARSRSPRSWSRRPRWPPPPAWASVLRATGSCASRSSRTSSASARPCATCEKRSPSF
ncbi:MAG: Aspartate aminotransferase, partial [uncultured Acidimicrobiales bacterium]